MTNEFLELVRPQTVISKLNLRAVPLNVRVLRELGGAVGYWVGEGMPAPLTSNAFDTVTLPPVKVGALAVLTKETINAPLSQAEPEVLKSLVSAAAEKANEYFLDDSGEVSGIRPAGILNNVVPIVSTGDAVQDLALLIEAYGGDHASAAWVMRPSTATQLHMVGARSSSSTFVDLRDGGLLFGLRVTLSSQVPQDTSGGGTIILLDTAQILLGSGAVEIASSREATLEFLNNPSNSSATATGTTMVSLFQTDSVAQKVQRQVNWTVTSSDAVVALSGVNYSSTST